MDGKQRTTRGWLFLPVLVLAVTTCTEHRNVTSPDESAGDKATVRDALVVEITCHADVKTLELSCEPLNRVGTLIGPQFLIVGGQGTYVTLSNPDPSYNPGTDIFSADVTVQNLIPQALGTPDGTEVTGVRVFFHTQPYATLGEGAVEVNNEDGNGTFTGATQPYFEYMEVLDTNGSSAPRTWEWLVPGSVSSFAFQVYVQADVQYPGGWVEVGNTPNAVGIGGNVTLTHTIKDVVGRTVSGTVTWSSPDETVATVGASSGTVTGVGGGVVDIVASSDVSSASGAGRVTVIDVSGYDIELRYQTDATEAQRTAFENAVSRWESLITGNLGAYLINQGPVSCAPAINEVIDDLLIFVTLEPIDGTGGILGSAGPCYIRPGTDPTPVLSLTGRMRFDTADLANLEAGGQLEDVIVHEMAHVLGLGTLWNQSPLSLQLGVCNSDPYFVGDSANVAFDRVGGGTYVGNTVPVENTGGEGTICGHWRESVFDNELMTGWIDSGSNPLSEVTVKSFEDMLYTVASSGWDSYTLPSPALLAGPKEKLFLGNDIWVGPVYTVPPQARLELPGQGGR
jgi:hypothetical protein